MRDRTDLLLPGSQAELVQAVRSAMGPSKPLILVRRVILSTLDAPSITMGHPSLKYTQRYMHPGADGGGRDRY